MKSKVLLSFDVEEFDLPMEYGGKISLAEGVKMSAVGVEKILDMTRRCGVKATFFVTGNFAEGRPDLVERMVREGHEVGCHGVDHFEPKVTDVEKSREIVGKVVEKCVKKCAGGSDAEDGGHAGGRGRRSGSDMVLGWRQPRMFKIDYGELKRCGFMYDTSVNPAWIPGRYNNFGVARMPYDVSGVTEVPVSVATGLRVPLFWLALHLFPLGVYEWLARRALAETGYLATYFHPWEFNEEIKRYSVVPGYIRKTSGGHMVKRLEKVIMGLKKRGCEFEGYGEFVEEYRQTSKMV